MDAADLLSTLDRLGYDVLRATVSVLWQSSILLAAVVLLAWALRRRRPAVRHVLWAGAVLAVPMIPLLGSLASRAGARVLAISDLDGSCQEGGLCDAAAALFSAGADLDLVVIGGAPVPACLDQIGGDEEPPFFAAAPIPPTQADFRVVREERRKGDSRSALGKVGGEAVNVAPGRVRVIVDLDPPVEVGPVDLAPNASLRIRILEVPEGEPRRWEVFVDGADVRGDEGSVP